MYGKDSESLKSYKTILSPISGPNQNGRRKKRSANDQRSDVFNPTSGDSQAAFNNRSNQLNPNSQAYRSSRFKGKK